MGFHFSHIPDFNPHFRKGSDGNWQVFRFDYTEFQSTLPQGKWPQSWFRSWWRTHFNPHFRKGSDYDDDLILIAAKGFQSTLPQGKWRQRQLLNIPENYFNPHFRKGSDSWHQTDWFTVLYFNPHFRKGSDGDDSKPEDGIYIFQSTLPQGKWLIMQDIVSDALLFQSTLPQGKWLQYFTKTSVYFYEISINIFEFTFVYYWNTLSIQKAHSNLFIFTGASLPVILCMLDTRTCKL